MICSKLSIGCLLLRISIRKLHTYIIYAAMMTSIIAGGTFFFVCLFQCEPVSYMWNKNQHGTCINNTVITALGYVYSIFSIVSDFTFTLIPGFLVWNLQLKMRTKLALVPLITMGCIASAAVIARLPFVKHFNSPDFLCRYTILPSILHHATNQYLTQLGATLDIAIWSSVEQGLAITAGSLATLRPLFYLAIHRLGFTTRGTSRTHPSHYGMSDPNPKNATLSAGNNIQADTLRPDKYHLSATVRTQCSSDDDSIPRAGCFDYKSPENWGETRGHQRSNNTSNNDNESERSLRVRDCEEEDDNMHIMVSKSFYITDEERASIISQGDRPYQ